MSRVKRTVLNILACISITWILISSFFFLPSLIFFGVLLKMSTDDSLSEGDAILITITLGILDLILFIFAFPFYGITL